MGQRDPRPVPADRVVNLYAVGAHDTQFTFSSFATESASHFMPWLPKFTCSLASLPLPSALTMTPRPKAANALVAVLAPAEGAAAQLGANLGCMVLVGLATLSIERRIGAGV